MIIQSCKNILISLQYYYENIKKVKQILIYNEFVKKKFITKKPIHVRNIKELNRLAEHHSGNYCSISLKSHNFLDHHCK